MPGNTVGERVRWARQQANMTIRGLANLSTISEVTISKTENKPGFKHRVGTIRTLAHALGQPIWFVGCYELLNEDTFGAALKKLRLSAGLYPYEMANQLGVDPSLIIRYENEQSCPSTNTMRKLLQFASTTNEFGQSAHDLLQSLWQQLQDIKI